MNETELTKIVNNKLSEFEMLDRIHPESDLNLKLMSRIETASSSSKSRSVQFVLIVILLISINIGFLLTINKKDNHRPLNRKGELSIVSKELLINPISINN